MIEAGPRLSFDENRIVRRSPNLIPETMHPPLAPPKRGIMQKCDKKGGTGPAGYPPNPELWLKVLSLRRRFRDGFGKHVQLLIQ
jgi:hypothetical protein